MSNYTYTILEKAIWGKGNGIIRSDARKITLFVKTNYQYNQGLSFHFDNFIYKNIEQGINRKLEGCHKWGEVEKSEKTVEMWPKTA